MNIVWHHGRGPKPRELGTPASRQLLQHALKESQKSPENEETIRLHKSEPVKMERAAEHLVPYLVQIMGGQTGRMFKLTELPIRIGRSTQCQVAYNDPHISRIHAEIVQGFGSDIVIRDLGSANGIIVNETRLAKHDQFVLKDGDKITIGSDLCLKFCYQDVQDESFQKGLFRAANIDALTQLYNKKYFIEVLERELSFTRRSSEPLSLAMIDVDFFKKINDQHGHLAGDQVLKELGILIQKQLRSENVACRYGGEEFAMVLRNTTKEQAAALAERLRTEISNHSVSHAGHDIRFTISAGIATVVDDSFKKVEDFVKAADAKLYEAKAAGRNKVLA